MPHKKSIKKITLKAYALDTKSLRSSLKKYHTLLSTFLNWHSHNLYFSSKNHSAHTSECLKATAPFMSQKSSSASMILVKYEAGSIKIGPWTIRIMTCQPFKALNWTVFQHEIISTRALKYLMQNIAIKLKWCTIS